VPHRRPAALLLVAVAIGGGCVAGRTEEKAPPVLPEVRKEDAPVEYIQRECLPILNGLVDSLCAAKDKFPELASIQPRPVKDPFGEFLYHFRVKAVPGQKAMLIEPGGCSIVLFLEAFSRWKDERAGCYTTTCSHSAVFRHKEYDGLAIRFNYEFRLGTPNDDLEKLFKALLDSALAELAKKQEEFLARKGEARGKTGGGDAAGRAPRPDR